MEFLWDSTKTGVWHDDKDRTDKSGRVPAPVTKFRNFITPDGSPGPTGDGGFPAEAGRYHLYMSLRLPVGASHADLPQAEEARQRHFGFRRIARHGQHRLDLRQGGRLDRRSSLWHGKARRHLSQGRSEVQRPCHGAGAVGQEKETIVSNESAEIIRMFTARSMPSPTTARTILRQRCAARSTASTSACSRPSITASIAQALRRRNRLTSRRSMRCLKRSMRLRLFFQSSVISSAMR